MIEKNIVYISLIFTLLGCGDQSPYSVYEVEKDNQVYERSTGNLYFSWQAPAPWVFDKLMQPMQHAMFFAAHKNDPYLQNDHTTAKISISFIEGVAFDNVSNIERWQRQLSPTAADVQTNIAQITTEIGRWDFVKLSFHNKAMFVAVFESFEGTLFIKMTGNEETLFQEAERFVQFVESVQEKNV